MPRLFLSYSPPGIPLSSRSRYPTYLPLAQKLKILLWILAKSIASSFFFERAAATSVMNSVWYVYAERFMNIAS